MADPNGADGDGRPAAELFRVESKADAFCSDDKLEIHDRLVVQDKIAVKDSTTQPLTGHVRNSCCSTQWGTLSLRDDDVVVAKFKLIDNSEEWNVEIASGVDMGMALAIVLAYNQILAHDMAPGDFGDEDAQDFRDVWESG